MTWLMTAWLAVAVPVLADGNRDSETTNPPSAKKEEVRTAGRSLSEPAGAARASAPSPVEVQIQQLKEFVQAQAQELEAQRAALREQQRKVQALENQLKATITPRENVSAAVGNPEDSSESMGPASNATGAAATRDGGSPQAKEPAGPLAIRFKGITLTPGGFMVAETVWRQRSLSADVNTPFNAIPFPGGAPGNTSSVSRVPEFNASGRQSRISMLAEGKLSSVKIGGYYEADFLSAGLTSNNNQSNSYTFRQRQFWGQAALDSGWTFTGGQMWSLVTETKKGLQNRTEAPPLTIDAQYTAGFSWARQYGFRVAKSFQDKFWLALSVEAPQTTFGGRGFPGNFIIAAPGAGGGLFNATANYSINETPDFILKAAFEPGWGHYEIFGVIATFRSRIFPCATASAASPCPVNGTTTPSAVGAFNNSRTGGGIGANVRVPILNKKVDVGLHFLGGGGINRYGTTGLANATARRDGTLALIRGGQALGTIEWHVTPMLDLYFNGGGEYAARAAFLNAAGTAGVGYGSPLFNNSGCNTETLPANQNTPGTPGTCAGDTRNIIEGTFGFWHRFYKGDKGTLQWGLQYSYVVRNTWSGTGPTPGTVAAPRGIENMFFSSFRYYLP